MSAYCKCRLKKKRWVYCSNVCLFQVGLASKIDAYITQDKLFHALKVLEELRAEIACFRVCN
jgi:hypothetical protein